MRRQAFIRLQKHKNMPVARIYDNLSSFLVVFALLLPRHPSIHTLKMLVPKFVKLIIGCIQRER
jgi:hypothetical protein